MCVIILYLQGGGRGSSSTGDERPLPPLNEALHVCPNYIITLVYNVCVYHIDKLYYCTTVNFGDTCILHTFAFSSHG